MIDGDAPGAVLRIRNKLSGEDNGALNSAIRFLDLGSAPDPAMQATYEQEDQLEWAEILGEAGHWGAALKALDRLAKPFQETSTAARVRRDAYYALGCFEEALAYADTLIAGKTEGNSYRIAEDCLRKAELRLLTGDLAGADELLDQRRESLLKHYTYFGIRAAIALAQGDHATARQFVQRAAQRNCYHCYKLLWLHSPRPLPESVQ